MEFKDYKERMFLDIINQLEAYGQTLKPKIRGYVLIAITAVEMILMHGYCRTREEIDNLRQQI